MSNGHVLFISKYIIISWALNVTQCVFSASRHTSYLACIVYRYRKAICDYCHFKNHLDPGVMGGLGLASATLLRTPPPHVHLCLMKEMERTSV